MGEATKFAMRPVIVALYTAVLYCISLRGPGSIISMAPQFSRFKKQSDYFILYVSTGEIKEISRELFSKLDYPVITSRGRKFRIVGCKSRVKTKQFLDTIEPQGLIGDISQVFSDLGSLGCMLMSMLNFSKSITKKDILSIASIFIKVADLFKQKQFCPMSVVSMVIDLYLIYSSFNRFEAQGLESIVSMACANFIPDKLFAIIKKSQYLSSVKILDDISYFHDFVVSVLEAIDWLIQKVPLPSFLRDYLDNLMLIFKSSSDHLLIRDLEQVMVAAKDCKVFLDLGFREKSKKLNLKLEASHSLKEWTRRSSALMQIVSKWQRHIKIIEAYENPGRVEPTCFVFEGPPGKKKSVVMNAVIEALGEPFYAHCVKAVMDGKDFYDNYNNEPIFYMDDVGQNGVSQWRPLMNMVSSVKMPLDCAEAQNKDTKFFNSNKIFITTNRFQTLNLALTKQDCIDDIQALWRRGYVFDFSGVTSTSNFIAGTVVFKHYDLHQQCFIKGFPSNFKREMEKRQVSLPSSLEIVDRSQLLSWICKIVKLFDLMKRNYAVENRLTESEKQTIQEELQNLEYFDAQSEEVPKSYFREVIESCLVDFVQVVVTYASQIKNFICDYAAVFVALGCVGLIWVSAWWFDTTTYYKSDGFRYAVDYYHDKRGNPCVVYVDPTKGETPSDRNIVSAPMNNLESIPILFDMHLPNKNYDYEFAQFCKGRKWQELFDSQSFKFDPANVHNSVMMMQKHVKYISVKRSVGDMMMRCLISGRTIVLPSHASNEARFSVIIYDDVANNKRLIDGDYVKVVYRNVEEDIMVCKLSESYPSPFKNLSNWFKGETEFTNKSAFLVSSELITPVGAVLENAELNYKVDNSVVSVKNAYLYNVQFNGLCGSVIFSPDRGILGMHVAGSNSEKLGIGMSWSLCTKEIIKKYMIEDKNLLPLDIKNYDTPNSSVIKLDKKMHVSAILKSNIGPSPLHGIYPIGRTPAILDKYGRHTVKEIGKAAFAVPGAPSVEEAAFARKAVSTMFGTFSDLPWDEVVMGNKLLNRLNKDSSNGYGCYPEKDMYIDFENGVLTDYCQKEIDKFEAAVESGSMREEDWDKLFWVETPKDEVRSNSKNGDPRTFRVGTIIQQILAKRYFGKFVEQVLKGRDYNMVMVGVNPIKEWPRMYSRMAKGQIFAGDVAKWDKGMVPQFQRDLFEVILSKYTGSRPKVAAVVLECLIHSLVIMLDDLYLTTHSLASGHFLTAIFNSLINRMYTAAWYYRMLMCKGVKPTIVDFCKDVVDFVYGDDKVNAIFKHADVLNAITMRDFFESLGLGFTDASKKPITRAFQSIEEITFLKRSFVYHNILEKIVCPLDLEVLQSGLSWVDYTKDIDLVMRAKVDNYQREIYLHPDRDFLLEDLKNRLSSRNWKLAELPEAYLIDLYSDDSDYEPSFGSNIVL